MSKKSKLTLCSVCHAATGRITRLSSGSSLRQLLLPGEPEIGDEHIDVAICPQCLATAAEALGKRVGKNAGTAIAIDFTGVLDKPTKDGKKSTPAKKASSSSRPKKGAATAKPSA